MAVPKQNTISTQTTQLSVICEDRPGTLAHLAKVLGDSKVNIVAMSCAWIGVQGVVRIIVDNVKKARSILDRERLSYTEQDVLQVVFPNSPGRLGEFAGKLAEENINIISAYGTSVKDSKKASVVFQVSDLEKAARIR
jgi:hypothetical protein